MKKCLLILSLALSFPASAMADFSFLCGKDREEGVDEAEIALVSTMEASHLYLKGKALSEDAYDVTNRGDTWIVTVYGVGDKDDRKIDFRESSEDAQEFTVSPEGGAKPKKKGGPISCTFTEKNS